MKNLITAAILAVATQSVLAIFLTSNAVAGDYGSPYEQSLRFQSLQAQQRIAQAQEDIAWELRRSPYNYRGGYGGRYSAPVYYPTYGYGPGPYNGSWNPQNLYRMPW